MESEIEEQEKKYFNKQLKRLNTAIAHLVERYNYKEYFPVLTPSVNFMVDVIKGIKSIGYIINTDGSPCLDKHGEFIHLMGNYDYYLTKRTLLEYGVNLVITPTHLDDIFEIRIKPTQKEWRDIIINGFLKNEE